MRAEIRRWLRGDLPADGGDNDATINDVINDAVEAIWGAMAQVQWERFFGPGSPLTFALPANTQRIVLSSIADPTVAPVAANVAGGALGARNYVLEYTFVTESGSETNPSPQLAFAATVNNLVQVTAPANPGTAFGWNLYAGSVAGVLALQNQQALPFGPVFLEPIAGFQDYPNFAQQPPTANATGDNVAWIEHLEVQTSDTLLRAWNQVGLDSEVMRRMARTLSSASEYQHFVWDLVGNNVLEFRPPPGLAFNPRYWAVLKPRRLRYDQAEVPYISVAGVHEYIRCKSIAGCKLALEEYLAVQAWEGKAGQAKMEVLLALNQENWRKDTRVVPHLF